MSGFSSLLLGIVCLISAVFLWFRQHAVARPKPSPSPTAISRSTPSPGATSWSTPLPTVPAWPSSTYGSTYRSSPSNSGRFTELQITPYGSDERLFGEFQCPSCNRKWASGSSWANTRQECQNCRIMVSPHYQRRLNAPAQETYSRDLTKPHLTEMCERCQQLGRDCSRRW